MSSHLADVIYNPPTINHPLSAFQHLPNISNIRTTQQAASWPPTNWNSRIRARPQPRVYAVPILCFRVLCRHQMSRRLCCINSLKYAAFRRWKNKTASCLPFIGLFAMGRRAHAQLSDFVSDETRRKIAIVIMRDAASRRYYRIFRSANE